MRPNKQTKNTGLLTVAQTHSSWSGGGWLTQLFVTQLTQKPSSLQWMTQKKWSQKKIMLFPTTNFHYVQGKGKLLLTKQIILMWTYFCSTVSSNRSLKKVSGENSLTSTLKESWEEKKWLKVNKSRKRSQKVVLFFIFAIVPPHIWCFWNY